jgi:hypothetical protein
MKSKNPIGILFGWLAVVLTPGHAAVDNLADGTASRQMAATAMISGRITNQSTGDSLPGAVVQIEGINISTVADRGGMYSLNIPKGSHVLTVSFSGLDTTRVDVAVPGGHVVKDVELTSQIPTTST